MSHQAHLMGIAALHPSYLGNEDRRRMGGAGVATPISAEIMALLQEVHS